MTPLFHCEVLGQPIPQSRPKIVRATGRVYYGKRATAQRKLLLESFFYAKRPHAKAFIAICAPVSVLIEVAGMHGNADLDNAAKLVLDSLVDAGVLVTDKASVVGELVVRTVDGPKRTSVTVYTIEKPEAA